MADEKLTEVEKMKQELKDEFSLDSSFHYAKTGKVGIVLKEAALKQLLELIRK